MGNMLSFERMAEMMKLAQEVMALYQDLSKDGTLETPENLKSIVKYLNGKSDLLSKYVAPNEVLLLVCGVIGLLHEGDTSNMYDELKAMMNGN